MRNHLTDLEKTFFDFCIENPEKLNQLTIVQIANELFISKATISRTCQKLGFSGFKEFKYTILSRGSDDHQAYVYNKSRQDFYELIINRLAKTADLINHDSFNCVLKYIRKAHNIEVFSVGGSYSSGFELSRKLRHLGYRINTRSDWDELEVISRRLSKDDLAIFLSQTGETEMLLNYQQHLVYNHCPIISIVGSKESTLAKESDQVIFCPTALNYIGDTDLSSRVSFIYIIDLISWELSENS